MAKKDIGVQIQAELAVEGIKLTKKQSEMVFDKVFAVVKKAVANGDKVQVQNFGNFEAVERAARKGRNPQTGEEINIAAKKAPKFAPAKAFKDAVK